MSVESQPVKAKLRVILMADGVTVAETINPSLWQQVLGEIHGRGTSVPEQSSQFAPTTVADGKELGSDPQDAATTLDRLSRMLEIDRTQTEAAIAPTAEAPYLTLDVHCWEK